MAGLIGSMDRDPMDMAYSLTSIEGGGVVSPARGLYFFHNAIVMYHLNYLYYIGISTASINSFSP